MKNPEKTSYNPASAKAGIISLFFSLILVFTGSSRSAGNNHLAGKQVALWIEDAAYLGHRVGDGLRVYDKNNVVRDNALGKVECNPDELAVKELTNRILPKYKDRFVFKQIEADTDIFELEQSGRKIVIRGNNANSMAVGLNYYLKNYCLTTVSWYADNIVQLPSKLPKITYKVSVRAVTSKRFFLNYCTFGYTMPWWKWKDWERFIDWMALNGINMPLAITGQEAVWQKVWKELGIGDEQIRAYFTGPAHLPWHRMNNIDYWQGPLPQGWIDSQAQLQKKILARERQLNMKPVLPAFAGHVPAQFAEMHPEASVSDIPEWGGFDNKYLCHFLSSDDPWYEKIQKRFLTIQTDMYGTDHIYGMDLFNEVEAPSWDPKTLASISHNAYKSLSAVDPDAIWLQMGWLFYADAAHWNQENMKAYMTAVPKGKLIMLDYYMERTEIWKLNNKFYGQDYILCYLGNFGGNTMLSGNFHETSARLKNAFENGGDNLVGIGSTLEGFGVNQFMYEFILDKAWNTGISDNQWVNNLADRHVGRIEPLARRAWNILIDSVYTAPATVGQATLINAHPCFKGHWRWTTRTDVPYSYKTLERVLTMLKNVKSDMDTWKYDIVNIERQLIGDSFTDMRNDFTSAYLEGDLNKARRAGEKMIAALDRLDDILAGINEFSLEKWVEGAKSFAVTDTEKAYYAENARTLISIWGDSITLTDYGSRTWHGMVSSYYKVRWKMFIDGVLKSMEEGKDFDVKSFDASIRKFEKSWAKGKN